MLGGVSPTSFLSSRFRLAGPSSLIFSISFFILLSVRFARKAGGKVCLDLDPQASVKTCSSRDACTYSGEGAAGSRGGGGRRGGGGGGGGGGGR